MFKRKKIQTVPRQDNSEIITFDHRRSTVIVSIVVEQNGEHKLKTIMLPDEDENVSFYLNINAATYKNASVTIDIYTVMETIAQHYDLRMPWITMRYYSQTHDDEWCVERDMVKDLIVDGSSVIIDDNVFPSCDLMIELSL